MRMLIAAAFVFFGGLATLARVQSTSGPLPQFTGEYRVSGGDAGVIRIGEALGGTYTEWRVTLGQPQHELRMLVGARRDDGTFPVWRFEQEPAPRVPNQGVARLQGSELVAEFVAPANDAARHMIRERWKVTSDSLVFTLEANTQGREPQRVGGFVATRQ